MTRSNYYIVFKFDHPRKIDFHKNREFAYTKIVTEERPSYWIYLEDDIPSYFLNEKEVHVYNWIDSLAKL